MAGVRKCSVGVRELPWVPVTAQDGRTYEKEAIETHFKTLQGKGLPIKSPITNEPMGGNLLPVPHIKSLIETLIDNKAIQGDTLEAWNEKVQEQKTKKDLLQKANEGSRRAMFKVAQHYAAGSNGFGEDAKLAFKWYKKAHAAGNVKATSFLGDALVNGKGVRKSRRLGSLYITQAATAGSDFAAYSLGKAFATGSWSLPENEDEAIFWLRKCLGDCAHFHMTKDMKKKAQGLLEELRRTTIRPRTLIHHNLTILILQSITKISALCVLAFHLRCFHEGVF
ncbi:Sel1 domain protein repeat-containing protein [Seminavis robusta]|uniref:Sel1 domain protein repeat-containing protein n=1 Tax=Seminavis robusta TaxID=568900 RepID=A0A9N8HMM1_9STRA|nr:Sel1 domain protein repeat-containing protein [Seminavis robusta]|eukprot:Sro1011_g231080.1 Sel1 domain protein repeat-containing protein (281) ;mRNA; f:26548-27486